MSDLRVKVGEPPTAVKWNRLVDRLPFDRMGGAAKLNGWPVSQLQVKNDSGYDVEIGQPLAKADYTGPESVRHAAGNITVDCVEFAVWPGEVPDVVIAAADIPDGKYGPAWVSGMAVVKIEQRDTDHRWVWFSDDEDDPIQTGDAGQAKIITVFGDSDKYALVNLDLQQPLWRFETTGDPVVWKLADADGTLTDQEFEITDPFGFFDGIDSAGWKGWVNWIDDKFYPAGAPCEKPAEEEEEEEEEEG